jgi:predicted HTH transcriptional regulator
VTLYSQPTKQRKFPEWHTQLMGYLSDHKEITTKTAAEIWNVTARKARTRLRSLVKQGWLVEIGTGPKDPKKVYVLK